MSRFFRLATDCFFVDGAREGALYDVHGGRLLLLQGPALALVRRCERNEPVGDDATEAELRILAELRDRDLGFFDDDPAFVDKMLIRQPIEWLGMAMAPPAFKKATWAITQACDLHCALCGRAEETVSWQSCQTCLRRDRDMPQRRLPVGATQRVEEIAALGVRLLHIRGGNPLLAWEVLVPVVEAARRFELPVVVTTPGTGRGVDGILDLLRGGGVELNLVMFGLDPAAVEQACGHKEVLAHQLALIAALAELEMPFYVTGLLMGGVPAERQRLESFFGAAWRDRLGFAEVYERQAIQDGMRSRDAAEAMPRLTPWSSVEEFYFRLHYNPCTFGNFEIGADGALRSCAGLSAVHADLQEGGLQRALSGDGLYEEWRRDPMTSAACRACCLRYACSPCPALAGRTDEGAALQAAHCPRTALGTEPRSPDDAQQPAGLLEIVTVAGPAG